MTIRIGYFPNNNSLFVLRHNGLLERYLPDVEWVDLRELSAPPRVDLVRGCRLHSDWLFEDGGYDFIGTGFTPPITGLGQGRDLVYVGISGPRVENGRLVSLESSGIRNVADLCGKRVGIAHGSWQTTLALLALDREGLRWDDIVPVDVDVNDGGAAWCAEISTRGSVPTRGWRRSKRQRSCAPWSTPKALQPPIAVVRPTRVRRESPPGARSDHHSPAGIGCVDRRQPARSSTLLRRRCRTPWRHR